MNLYFWFTAFCSGKMRNGSKIWRNSKDDIISMAHEHLGHKVYELASILASYVSIQAPLCQFWRIEYKMQETVNTFFTMRKKVFGLTSGKMKCGKNLMEKHLVNKKVMANRGTSAECKNSDATRSFPPRGWIIASRDLGFLALVSTLNGVAMKQQCTDWLKHHITTNDTDATV